jgi:hypothetical protein
MLLLFDSKCLILDVNNYTQFIELAKKMYLFPFYNLSVTQFYKVGKNKPLYYHFTDEVTETQRVGPAPHSEINQCSGLLVPKHMWFCQSSR